MPCFDSSFLVTCKVDKALQFAWHICNCSLKRTENFHLYHQTLYSSSSHCTKTDKKMLFNINMYHNVFTCVFLK